MGKKLEALADGRKVQVIKIIRSSIPTTVNDNTSTNYKVKVIMKEQIMVTILLFRYRRITINNPAINHLFTVLWKDLDCW